MDTRTILLAAPVIIFSLTVHEFFHAWAAYRCGDSTARMMGRLTLNPLRHLDLFGTLMMFITEFRFGWAKPVPVNPANLRHPRRDDFWISAAGPLSNLGLGLLSGLTFRMLAATSVVTIHDGPFLLLYFMISTNVSLAFFNLLPIFPLDGSHIFRSILPPSYGPILDQVERVSPIILMVLILSGLLFGVSLIWMILGPFIGGTIFLFSGIG